ncbi:MAG: 1-(5-phosphoribosyl)-5-[(5-phosphoribosylamino)methylideneamino]imidazole-4-carboxamide isomerase [Woeseiaceae bacterium]|nr:1-(5-phosphoribosyl)-5-[(5-phosphoribosylamino)methylideneamino]imidazole-4-carboxamide isomerase [Woeseiaceae bacterium]
MNVIPAIDLRNGRCVRLYQGDFNRQTNYPQDPASLAADYDRIGFEYLHVVDLDGARTGSQQNELAIRKILAATRSLVQLGGGIRSESQLAAWLDRGIQRVVVGSMAIDEATYVRQWLSRYGTDRIVLALDVTLENDEPWLTKHGWTRRTDLTLWECLDSYSTAGLKHVLCTDVSRDGTLGGPNLELYAQIVSRYPDLSLQASGGVRRIEDLQTLQSTGASAAITGRALLDGEISTEEIQTFLRAA